MIDRHNIQLSRLAPMLLHGDEGRGRKKMPFLITSYHSMIGFGTTLANEQRKQRLYLQLRLNYSGSSHTTRMISGCLPKMTKDEVALKDLLSFTAGDCMRTFQTGVANQEGERYHAICLNAVGDWMWLAKAANLQRSFANVPKQALVPTSVPKGICHYCHAGQTNYDLEDLGFNPAWKRTMFLPGDQPWKSRPALLDLPHDPSQASRLFFIWYLARLPPWPWKGLCGIGIGLHFWSVPWNQHWCSLSWADGSVSSVVWWKSDARLYHWNNQRNLWMVRSKDLPERTVAQGSHHDDAASFFGVMVFKKRCFTGCNRISSERRAAWRGAWHQHRWSCACCNGHCRLHMPIGMKLASSRA